MQKTDEQVEKELALIEMHYKVQEKLSLYFSEKKNCLISQEDIFQALFMRLIDKHNLEWLGDLWNVDLHFDEAVQLLSDFDFESLKSKLSIDAEILPKGLLMKHKVLIKSKGIVWIIHKYDKDPFPSNPHAHQLDNNIKLDLSNGKCYKIRKHVYTISQKDLLDIREKASKLFKGELPTLVF